MLSDITIGQYFPGNSLIHRLDPRFKIIITGVFIVMLFAASSFISAVVSIVFMIIAYLLSKIPARLMVKSLKPIMPVVLFTAVLNLLFINGVSLWHFAFINITDEGLRMTGFMIIRIVVLISGSSLLTYTTSPIVLTDAIEQLLAPLKKIGFPVHELAMMMTIALRFIPTLIEETDKIMSAQKARGADMESGGIVKRAKALVPVLIPLFISAFRRAEELALAMECRCYQGGEGRTKLRVLHSGLRDYVAIGISLLFLAGVFVLNGLTG